MKVYVSFFLSLVFIGHSWCGGYRSPEEVQESIETVNQLPISRSVCSISTDFSNKSNIHGTGVCIDSQWLATALHVLEGLTEDDPKIFFEGISPRSIGLQYILEFPAKDIALIKLTDPLPTEYAMPLISAIEYQNLSDMLSQGKVPSCPSFFLGYGDKIASNPLSKMPSQACVTKAINKEIKKHFPYYVEHEKSIAQCTLTEYGVVEGFESHAMFASHYHTSQSRAYAFESFALPGDSGAPLVVRLEEQYYIAGVTIKTLLEGWKPQGEPKKKNFGGTIKTIFSSVYDHSGKNILELAQEQDS